MTSKRGFIEHLTFVLSRLFADIKQALLSPQANPRTTFIVMAILAIVALIISLLVWIIMSSVFKKKNALIKIAEEKDEKAIRKDIRISRIVFAIAVLLAASGVYAYGTRNSVCVRCHDQALAKNLQKTYHKEVACTACHGRPGVMGYAAQAFDYVRWIKKYAVKQDDPKLMDADIRNSSCLRCHGRIAEESVIRYGVKVRHVDFLKVGARCVECHSGVAHGEATENVKVPSMDKCVRCHDAKRASADCSVCHVDTANPSTRKVDFEIIRTDIPPMKNCRGCHAQTKESVCIKCHGLEMPHPDGWVSLKAGTGINEHAKQGFLEKEMCKRCHAFPDGLGVAIHPIDRINPQIFCDRCHSYPAPHGSPESWRKRHGPMSKKQLDSTNALCDDCHEANNEQQCTYCHTKNLCKNCHVNDGVGL